MDISSILTIYSKLLVWSVGRVTILGVMAYLNPRDILVFNGPMYLIIITLIIKLI